MEREAPRLSTQDIADNIRVLKEMCFSTVILAGGEPTIREDFRQLADSIREHGMNIGLITNCRMFAYKSFAERFVGYEPEYVQVLLPGHNEEIHDALTGVAGSFKQTVAGLRNIAAGVKTLKFHTVITRVNIEYLNHIVALAGAIRADSEIMFSLPENDFADAKMRELYFPDVAAAAAAVDAAIDLYRCVPGRKITFSRSSFIPCVMPAHRQSGTDFCAEKILSACVADEDGPAYYEATPGKYFKECLHCSQQLNCPGANARVSAENATPFCERMPNSLGYDFTRSYPVGDQGECPGGASFCGRHHRYRETAVLVDGNLDIFEVANDIYSCPVMKMVKFEREQLYLNTAGHTRNLDFRTAFKRIVLHEGCHECDRAGVCSCVFVPVGGNVYAGVVEKERALLGKLEGKVLDIGCGTPVLLDLFESKVRNGEIEYTGVDSRPHEGIGLDIINRNFEDFESAPNVYDHVLLLRSYNHFRDPVYVVRRIVDLLKPGGTLYIFENGIFANLKKDVAEDPPANPREPVYEHFRNHYSEDALRLIRSVHDFKTVHHSPVTPDTANQWFLVLKK